MTPEQRTGGYAAVGTDGRRLVVWGLGASGVEAMRVATEKVTGDDRCALTWQELTAGQVEAAKAGIIDWQVLQETSRRGAWQLSILNEEMLSVVLLDASLIPNDEHGNPDAGGIDWPTDAEVSAWASVLMGRSVEVMFWTGGDHPDMPEQLYDYEEVAA